MDMHNLVPVMGLLVPIIAIVMGIGISALAMMLDFKRRERLVELHHKERMAAIERGMEVPPLPPEFFESHRSIGRRGRSGGLAGGMTVLFIGVAATIALYFNFGVEKAVWGLVLVAIGAARLLAHALQDRAPAPGPQPPAGTGTGAGTPG